MHQSSLVVDREQYNRFVELMPELTGSEVYFLSLSARSKYLTDDEREKYKLTGAEMFSRQTAFDKPGLEYALVKMEAELGYKRTKSGQEFPAHALVVYVNVNPSSLPKAYGKFMSQMAKIQLEAFETAITGKEPDFKGFHNMPRKILSAIQAAKSRRIWVDIDIDLGSAKGDQQVLFEIKGIFDEEIIIQTRSGFHALVAKERAGNYSRVVKMINHRLSEFGGECQYNSNAMVPMPGTVQGGSLVKFID